MLERLLSPSYVSSFVPACTDTKFPRSGENSCSRNPKADEASK